VAEEGVALSIEPAGGASIIALASGA
jgi:hypothetical protein